MIGYDSNRNQILPDLVFENAKEAEKNIFKNIRILLSCPLNRNCVI